MPVDVRGTVAPGGTGTCELPLTDLFAAAGTSARDGMGCGMTLLHRATRAPESDVVERLAKAAFLVVVALGATEEVRYRRDRAYRAIDRWWADVEHREREELLRSEMRTIAGQLVPVVASRIGHRP